MVDIISHRLDTQNMFVKLSNKVLNNFSKSAQEKVFGLFLQLGEEIYNNNYLLTFNGSYTN